MNMASNSSVVASIAQNRIKFLVLFAACINTTTNVFCVTAAIR